MRCAGHAVPCKDSLSAAALGYAERPACMSLAGAVPAGLGWAGLGWAVLCPIRALSPASHCSVLVLSYLVGLGWAASKVVLHYVRCCTEDAHDGWEWSRLSTMLIPCCSIAHIFFHQQW